MVPPSCLLMQSHSQLNDMQKKPVDSSFPSLATDATPLETLGDTKVAVVEAATHAREDEAMDGGINAWCSVVGGWLGMAATFGYQNAFGVFQDYYGRAHAASNSSISWIGSTQLFLLTSMGLFAGKLLDRGFFRETILVGSLIYVFSLFMLSLAHPGRYYQLFLSQGLGMGLGSGLIYIPCLAIQSHHWRKRRALALGIVFSGSSAGGIVFPILLNNLINRGVGFPWTVRASAFIVLFMLILANLLMRSRSHVINATGQGAQLKVLFKDVPYVFLILGAFLSLAGMFFPYFYVQVYARLHGVDANVSFYTLAILNAASIPGRVLPNFFVHSYGLFNMLIVSGIGSAVIIFALFGINSLAGVLIFAILAGFMSGAFLSLLAGATASLAHHPSEVGLRMGLAFAIAAFGSLIGTPIDGALLGDSFTWSKPVIFSGVMIVVGTGVLAISRQLLARRRGISIM